MTAEEQAYAAWSAAIGDRVEHQDDCQRIKGGCSAPFSTKIALCPDGQRLADAEEAAHQAWRQVRAGQVVQHAGR